MEILDKLWKSRHPKDALFLELIDGYSIKKSKKYPNDIFYIKGKKILIDYNKKTKYAYINDVLIWSKFEFDLNYKEVSNLLKSLLETHLKLKNTIVEMMFRYMTEDLEAKLKLIEWKS